MGVKVKSFQNKRRAEFSVYIICPNLATKLSFQAGASQRFSYVGLVRIVPVSDTLRTQEILWVDSKAVKGSGTNRNQRGRTVLTFRSVNELQQTKL